MELSDTIKKAKKIYTLIVRSLVDPSFQFPGGSGATKSVESFHNLLVKEYGEVTPERVVDFCVDAAYRYRDTQLYNQPKQVFGNVSFVKYKSKGKGLAYYQNQWLAEAGLSRDSLLATINVHRIHPFAQYIYPEAEEATKLRRLNTVLGFIICQKSTLGWTPFSKACSQCDFTKECSKDVQRKNPELYRLRTEEWQKNK